MRKLRAVRPWDVPFLTRANHYLHRETCSILSALIGSEALLNAALRRAVAQRDGVFGLPVSFVRASLGRELDISIDASVVRRVMRALAATPHGVERLDTWFVGSGNWAKVSFAIERDAIYREARALHDTRLRFQEAEVYEAYRKRLEAGRSFSRRSRRIDSVVALDAYFAEFVTLFQSIRDHGLLPQERTLATDRWFRYRRRAIGVAIGADGALYKLPGGQHRFAVALVLDYRAPVEVRMIHRDRLAATIASGDASPTRLLALEVARRRMPDPS